MRIAAVVIAAVVDTLIETGAHTATKYLTERHIVRATRVLYDGKVPRKGSNVDVRLTVGRPNYVEREFIKKLKRAGEPFPVKNVQLKFPPKRKR